MDINLNYSEDDNPLALKSDFILSLCELVIGGKEGLQPVEKTVIDRAVRNVYRPFLADPDPAKMPILGDLYNELLKQPEPEAARIAAALELYVSGSLNVFNHRTNVELSNRLVCFDIKQLGKGNNGLEKCKYITFSIEADNLAAAKARLSRIETDVLNNFKVLGVTARPMNGQERLNVLHGIFHPEGEPFRFSWDWLVPSGLTTKDFIAPSSFRFGDGRTFRMGRKLGAVMIEKERSEQMDEWKTGYSSYDHDRLEAADKMKIERGIYFDTKGADISPLTALPLAELVKLREESAAAEQTVFENLKVQASAWEEQAGKTLLFDKAIEYARIPEVKHTANKWQDEDNDRHTISNRVYKMSYHVYENTRYDKAAQKSIPYSYTLSWNIYTNSPHGYGQAKIAGQDRKVFADRAAMEKYLNGRIKAYEKLFTEISPAIPPEYAEQFKVNGQLLPGYTVEGEEIKQPAADIPAAAPRTEPGQDTEQFAILIDSRTRFETGEPGGCWLSMPATKEELHEAMQSVGITADNPQEFFIHGYSDREDRHIALPYDMVCAAQVDELNFLAARLETLDASGITALNAATQRRNGFENIGQLIDFTYNEDFFVHIPEVHNLRELGDYYLNKSGMVQMPAEWKNSIDLIAFGRNAAAQEKGSFTEYGYLVESGDAWEQHFEGRDVPEDYRIMSYPQPTVELDAAPAVQATVPEATPQEPRPVIPIVLTSEKPAEKLKEITDRLEQGITELFDSERYKEYLRVMSKFHNYSFNNTLLIAMQKPDASLIAGFSAWKNNFGRNVMKGQKGIKILAPSPFKIKKEMEKIDPQTQKAIIGKDGKPVTEEKEITIPAFKVVSVFDVSQTEGREIPDIAVNMLTGDVEHYKEVFAALEKTSPVPVGFEKIEGGAHGYYHLEDKRIALDEGMSELQTLKTLIHEIAHAKLSSQNIFVLTFGYCVGKLPPDFMGFSVIDFSRLKGLYQMVGEVVALIQRLRQSKCKFNVCRFIGAAKGGHKHFFIGLCRILDIVKGFV